MVQKSQSSDFRFQLVWGLHACGQCIITIFHLGGGGGRGGGGGGGGFLVSAEQLKNRRQIVISSPLGGTPSPVTVLS